MPAIDWSDIWSQTTEGFKEAVGFHILFSKIGAFAALLIIIFWFLSYILGWFFAFLMRLVFGYWIAKNERRKCYVNNTHKDYVFEYPWNMQGLTNSRIKCYEIIFGWIFFGFAAIGVLWAYQIGIILMGTPLGLFLAWIVYRPNVSTLLMSFIGRFRILWGDVVRVGETITYVGADNKITWYRVVWIGVFDMRITEVNKNKGLKIKADTRTGYSLTNTKPLPNYIIFMPDKVTLHPEICFGNKSIV